MLSTLRSAQQRATGEFGSVRDELEEIAQRLAALGERAISAGQSRVGDELSHLQDSVDGALGRLGGASRRAARRVGETVHDHPVSALVTAAAVGALLAVLLGRRG